ncbi:MAG: ABC transporter ATP-binding protein [Arcobacteraceae bacterium]
MFEISLKHKLHGADGDIFLNINTSLNRGDLTVLFGQSGAGKSTILKMIAGLIEPNDGKIIIDEEVWFDKKNNISLAAQKRKVGFVFQDYALFPNMSVRQNLLYALEDKSKANEVDEILSLMELTSLKNTKPSLLSGGQQQRVALARALVRKPKILLLDEPLSALDFNLRAKLQDELLRIQKHFSITTILVSHDISEVFKLANFVLELDKGVISKQGTPYELFSKENLSGKFKFTGEIVGIKKSDIVYIVNILIAQDIIKVIATKDEVKSLNIGDKVIVSSKAFNPLIMKI